MHKTGQQSAGFKVFAFAWAMACLFHQLSFSDWRWDDKGILLSVAVLFVLYKPSWQRFAVLVLVDWISVGWEFPVHPNHIVFSWVVNTTLLTSLVIAVSKTKGISEPDIAARWYEVFAPWVRIEMCILYFFTVFHKLNVSYFEVDLSCAAKLHLEINDRLPVMPEGKWALYSAIYGTLIIELVIPFLLLVRRTVVAGVFLGMLFHGLLALHGHAGLFSFSSTMMALFTTFLPLSIADAIKPDERIRKAWPWVLSGLALLLIVWLGRHLLPGGLAFEEWHRRSIWKVGFIGYYIYLPVSLVTFFFAQRTARPKTQQAVGSWRTHPGLIVFSLLLIVNGFGPYFGLKTQTSFSMFSNLHTENGVTNHLIMPSGIQLTNWQYDAVEIIGSSDNYLTAARERGHLVVYIELRRKRTVAGPDFWVTFRRDGKNETFDMNRPETYSTLEPLGPVANHYFYFRSFGKDPLSEACQQ